MGKSSSKPAKKLPNLERIRAKRHERHAEKSPEDKPKGKIYEGIQRDSTYMTYSLKAVKERDSSRTGKGVIGNFTEDVEGDSPNATVNQEDGSKSDSLTQSEPDYENLCMQGKIYEGIQRDNTYKTYSLKAVKERDSSRIRKNVISNFTEDVEGDSPNATVNQEDSSKSDSFTQSEPDYENLCMQADYDETAYDNVKYPVSSHDARIIPTEPGTEYRLSTSYVNGKFLIDKGRLECEAALIALRRHYRELKRRVCIQSVCDHLIQDGVLLEYDLENIMRGSYPRHARVDMLLQIMLRKKSQEVFNAFNCALRQTGCTDLADKLENSEVEVPDKPYLRQWSSQEVLNAWPGIEEFLTDELQPVYILDFFMQENIFSVDEYEAVFWSLGRRVEMTKTLLETMKKYLPEALFVLLYALEEVDKDIVEELEKRFDEGKDGQEAPKTCSVDESNNDIYLATIDSTAFPVAATLTAKRQFTIEMNLKKEGSEMEMIELEIDKYLNTNTARLLQIFIPLIGCEVMKSEHLTLHLQPHSKHAFQKLSKFCENGGLLNFVLNLLREKDIYSSLPEGEFCIAVQVKYHEGNLKVESLDTEALEVDLIESIKQNWSFLCEELDPEILLNVPIMTANLSDQEITEMRGLANKDRHEATDYFLTCLLNKGPTVIRFLLDNLRENKNMKVINRLQKSDPIYQNPQAVKENLIVYFESIIQEIDPSQFKETFVDRKILDGKFFTVLREKHLSRKYRAALFLGEVLNKGNIAIYALVDTMIYMGYDELVAKLVSLQDNLPETQQQELDDKMVDIMTVHSNEPSTEVLIWSCCMKLIVGKDKTDETKQETSGSSRKKEEQLYTNVQWNDVHEGIGGSEEGSPVILRSKESKHQMNRPGTHPESSLSHYYKRMTYPRTRKPEEVQKGIGSLIISASTRLQGDSISINEQNSENMELEEIRALDVMLETLSGQASFEILQAKTKSLIKKYRDFAREADWLKCLEDTLQKNLTESELRPTIFVILLRAHKSDFEGFLKTCRNRNDILQISIRYVLNVGDVQAKATMLNIAARELQTKVGKNHTCVWEGVNYRNEKGGELSLVCFYASDLQGQPKVFLGLPVLYKEWNTIENEPIENSLTEEYLHTSFTPEETEMKNILLHYYTKDLFEKHSNLEAVSASSVISSKTRGIIKTPSIVFYCRFKGVIPIGEDHFPKELRIRNIALPTDVREGFFTLGMMNASAPLQCLKPTEYQPVLKMGSSIGREGVQLAGTLGPFVKDNQGNTGFLTCAHVVGIDKQSTIKKYVVQPADSDSTVRGRNRVCGQIKNVCFDDQRSIGIDAAFIMIDKSKRDIDSINFAWNDSTQLDVAGFHHEKHPPSFLGGDVKSKINFDDVEGRRVIKCGRSTGLKKGSIALEGLSVRIHNSSLTFPTGMPWMSNINVVMKGQYLVESSGTPFFDLGDSGAGVYLVEHKQNKLSLIGLAIGLLNASYCVVTPIENVLEALGLEPDNVLSSEMMDVDLETPESSSSSFGRINGLVVHGNDRDKT